MCEKWGLKPSAINAIVTDNASNMVAAVRRIAMEHQTEDNDTEIRIAVDDQAVETAVDLMVDDVEDIGDVAELFAAQVNELLDGAIGLNEWSHVRCLAHTINLVVQNGIADINDIRSKVRRVVGFFHRSTIGAEKFIEKQTQLHPGRQPLRLMMEVTTRWNSAYLMFERVIAVKDALVAAIDSCADCEEVSRDEFRVMQGVVEVLEPFYDVTKELSAELNVSASKVIVLVGSLKRVLDDIRTKNLLPEIVLAMAAKMRTELTNRYLSLEGQLPLAMATFFNPRFKKHGFTSTGRYDETKKSVTEQVGRSVSSEESCDRGTAPTPAPAKSSKLWESFDRSTSHSMRQRENSTNLIEVTQYVNEGLVPRTDDPLTFWKIRQHTLPRLAKLAKRHLSLVATSVPSERVFSTAGQIVSARRSRLTPQNVEKIMFMNKNSTFFD